MSVNSPVPFGIAVAGREPVAGEHVDPSALVWDEGRQLMLVRDGDELMPWMKHSTGRTNTDSNTDGAGGKETDEDYTED